jgi:hypothetical protein
VLLYLHLLLFLTLAVALSFVRQCSSRGACPAISTHREFPLSPQMPEHSWTPLSAMKISRRQKTLFAVREKIKFANAVAQPVCRICNRDCDTTHIKRGLRVMGADGCGLDGDAGYAGSRTSSVYRAGVKIGGFCRFLGSGAVMIAIYRLPAVPESPFLALVPYRQRVAGPSGDPQTLTHASDRSIRRLPRTRKAPARPDDSRLTSVQRRRTQRFRSPQLVPRRPR